VRALQQFSNSRCGNFVCQMLAATSRILVSHLFVLQGDKFSFIHETLSSAQLLHPPNKDMRAVLLPRPVPSSFFHTLAVFSHCISNNHRRASSKIWPDRDMAINTIPKARWYRVNGRAEGPAQSDNTGYSVCKGC